MKNIPPEIKEAMAHRDRLALVVDRHRKALEAAELVYREQCKLIDALWRKRAKAQHKKSS